MKKIILLLLISVTTFGQKKPEDFGYNFEGWVTPYTKGAHKIGDIAIVLQDWTSSEAIGFGVNPEIQEYGRTLSLKTNQRLEKLLKECFGKGIKDIYGTNVFPFIKKGNISNRIPKKDIQIAAINFLKKEIEIVKPKIILALGNLAFYGLQCAGIDSIHLPHPAARMGSIDKHEKIWRERMYWFNGNWSFPLIELT